MGQDADADEIKDINPYLRKGPYHLTIRWVNAGCAQVLISELWYFI